MGDPESPNQLVFIRVTLLGMTRAGKSSLVNNVVNNAFSSAYSKTTEAALYYTTVRIQGTDEDQGHSTLIEIEDTFPSNTIGMVSMEGGDGIQYEDRDISDFFDFYWPTTKDKQDANLMKLKKEGVKEDDMGIERSLNKPLSRCSPPTDGIFHPLTCNRMAWLIVFDSNNEESYKEGVRVYEALKEYHEKKKDKMRPIIYFVANKIDKDPTSSTYEAVIASARAFADFNGVPFRPVSALQYKGVKRLFRNVVQEVRAQQVLWLRDTGVSKREEEEESKKCAIQ